MVDGKPAVDSYLAFFNGLNVFYAPIKDGSAMVPKELANSGTTYAAVTSVNSGMPTDKEMKSGLGVLIFGFSSSDMQ